MPSSQWNYLILPETERVWLFSSLPAKYLKSVDFPAPLAPMMAVMRPGAADPLNPANRVRVTLLVDCSQQQPRLTQRGR